jgi:hypothetical protein
MCIRPARLEPLALSASGRERMVNGRAAASGEKRIELSEEIALFGDILNIDGVLVEIGPRSFSVNQVVGGRQSPAGEGLRTTSPRWFGVERGAWGVRRENSGQGDGGNHPRFPGAKKWVAHSALSDDLWARWW